MIGLDNWQQRVNWLISAVLSHRWSTEPWHVGMAIQTKKLGPRHGEWCIDIPKLSYRGVRTGTQRSCFLVCWFFYRSHPNLRPSLLFLSFTDNKENERFACSFSWSNSYPFNHLSISPSFYLRLSPEAFHMSHLHICALKCSHLHCCHIALHWLSLVLSCT